jgi:hypothetical protein
MESHSLCLPGTAASVISLRNEMATPARQDALEARNDKLFNAFVFVYCLEYPGNLSLQPFIGDEHRNILLVFPIFLTKFQKELPFF